MFHAPASELAVHVSELPFAVVGDPDKRLYAEFGVEAAPRALLDPRVWPSIALAIADALLNRRPLPAPTPTGGRLGLPADFLIGSDGCLLAAKYAEHADDQWSVADLLAIAGDSSSAASSHARDHLS